MHNLNVQLLTYSNVEHIIKMFPFYFTQHIQTGGRSTIKFLSSSFFNTQIKHHETFYVNFNINKISFLHFILSEVEFNFN